MQTLASSIAPLYGVSTRRRAARKELLHALYVFRCIHLHRLVLRFHHANAIAVLQPAKLLELFDALQISLRKSGELQQRLAPRAIPE